MNISELNGRVSRRAMQKRDKLDIIDAQTIGQALFDELVLMSDNDRNKMIQRLVSAAKRRLERSKG